MLGSLSIAESDEFGRSIHMGGRGHQVPGQAVWQCWQLGHYQTQQSALMFLVCVLQYAGGQEATQCM